MSSETSQATAATTAQEKRLHPLSWLFLLLGQLKQFALPLVVVLFTGKRSDSDWWGLIGVGALVLYSLAQYFTYRYRIDADDLVIRSGLFQRSLRHIPFARIQNVSLHQSLLHRLFGVAEVRLESAGGDKPEGRMRVLRLDAAQELENLIRTRGAAAAVSHHDAGPLPTSELLLALPVSEVLLLGLVNNRGLLVVGGLFALLAQAGDNLTGRMFATLGGWLSGEASALHLSWLAVTAAAIVLLALLLVALRLLSMLIALLQFYGFRLSQAKGRLSLERGLLTRLRGSVPRHRIQAYSLGEGLLHRLLGRRSLRVDTAVSEAAHQESSLRDLVPIAPAALMDTLIDRLLRGDSAATAGAPAWPIEHWQALHPRAWRRKFMLPALAVVAATLLLSWFLGLRSLALLLLLPVLYWRAVVWARYAAYSVDNGLVAFRGGWLNRHWRFAESRKLQALELLQSPFDRRNGMATLRFDTAGASAMEAPLSIPYLPEAEARRLYASLARGLATPGAAAPLTRSRTAASATPAP